MHTINWCYRKLMMSRIFLHDVQVMWHPTCHLSQWQLSLQYLYISKLCFPEFVQCRKSKDNDNQVGSPILPWYHNDIMWITASCNAESPKRPVLKTLTNAPLRTNVNSYGLLATRSFFSTATLHPAWDVAKRTSVFITMQHIIQFAIFLVLAINTSHLLQ